MQCESWEARAAKNKSDTWINDVPRESKLLLCEEDWLLQDGTHQPQGTETEIETTDRKTLAHRLCVQPPTSFKAVYNNNKFIVYAVWLQAIKFSQRSAILSFPHHENIIKLSCTNFDTALHSSVHTCLESAAETCCSLLVQQCLCFSRVLVHPGSHWKH